MSTITKEWLLTTIAELEEERDAVPGAVNEDAANALAAMKLALASLEADGSLANEGTIPVTQFKPVADLYGLTSPTGGETSFTFDAVEARDFIDGGWSCQEYVELGRFQEAMLQNGNSPAQSDCCPEQNYIAPAQDGNSPALQDGWVACSERMPEDEQEVLTRNRMGHCFVSFFDEHSGLFFDRVDVAAACCIEHVLVTHWMPLPAAPQQEAK
ncbi:DUF551 domain-containing protein [Enterobacter hormaechei]|uniref:DUF551 domain-containing protein n=1 Tax=Enterobacter hormaechei TaxID=158836 RepID=UPI001CEF6059|nr:DUF551 domain-containing protein [Enterobacter hormaechei]